MSVNLKDRTPPQNLEWREISGWPGYRVSNNGRVQSCRITVLGGFSDTWHDLKPSPGRYGHLRVRLCREGERRLVFVHTLVLEAFVGHCPEGMEACHGPDADPSNNRISNLRWDTRKANHLESVGQRRHSHGERHGQSRLIEADIREIRFLYSHGMLQREIGELFGVSQVMISRIVRHRGWAHVA